jgi:hypothetical protein
MTALNRKNFVEMLERLGSDSDQTVLESARELHRNVTQAGVTWDDLLRPEMEPAAVAPAKFPAAAEEPSDPPPAAAEKPSHPPPAAAEKPSHPPPAAAPAGRSDRSALSETERVEAGKIIDRLLAGKNVSKNLREDLKELKRGIPSGEFEMMDLHYVRALTKRLGA